MGTPRFIWVLGLISLLALTLSVRAWLVGYTDHEVRAFYTWLRWVGYAGLVITIVAIILRLAIKHGRGE